MNSASLSSLAGRYDNPIPTLFIAPINCLKIPAREIYSFESIRGQFRALFSSCPIGGDVGGGGGGRGLKVWLIGF